MKISLYENSELSFLGVKYLIFGHTICWEQMYARLLNHGDNHCCQYSNKLVLVLNL